MERHFLCTACGKCCFGWLPLTISEALTHCGRFPLAVVLTPVRTASRAYDMTARLGVTVRTRDKKQVAVRITPMAYIPPSLPCPALTSDNLCGIHAEKPLRCRTMPFFPYQDDRDQTEFLVPRPGWACDVSPDAPVVYQDRAVLDPTDLNQEREAIHGQHALLNGYWAGLVKSVPSLIDSLTRALMKPGGGHVALSFASLLRILSGPEMESVARQQMRVLEQSMEAVASQPKLAEYHQNYDDWLWEIERLT